MASGDDIENIDTGDDEHEAYYSQSVHSLPSSNATTHGYDAENAAHFAALHPTTQHVQVADIEGEQDINALSQQE